MLGNIIELRQVVGAEQRDSYIYTISVVWLAQYGPSGKH